MQLGRRLRIRPVDGQQRDSTGFPTITHDLKPPDLHVQVIWWLEASQLLVSLFERFGRTLAIELQWSLVKLKEASQPGHMTSIKGVIKRGNPGSCGPASPSPLVVPMITSLELFVSLGESQSLMADSPLSCQLRMQPRRPMSRFSLEPPSALPTERRKVSCLAPASTFANYIPSLFIKPTSDLNICFPHCLSVTPLPCI